MLGVFVGANGVEASGGLLLQILPRAAEDTEMVTLIESRLAALTGFTPLLRANKTLPQIFADLVGDLGLEILPETQMVQFSCPCSFDRMLGALKMLGEEELQDMIETDNGAEAICHFCNEVYHTSSDQLAQLIEDLREDRKEATR
jgi:molecular chaperone Hsp33